MHKQTMVFVNIVARGVIVMTYLRMVDMTCKAVAHACRRNVIHEAGYPARVGTLLKYKCSLKYGQPHKCKQQPENDHEHNWASLLDMTVSLRNWVLTHTHTHTQRAQFLRKSWCRKIGRLYLFLRIMSVLIAIMLIRFRSVW